MSCLFAWTIGFGAVAETWTVTSNTTLAATDHSHALHDVIVRGATLTIEGPHTFGSLLIERSATNVAGVVTHPANYIGIDGAGLQLLITGDCTIQGASGSLVASRLDVNGKGHPAGQGPGVGANSPNSSFGTAGGGHGGAGGDSNLGVATGGACYGSVTEPIDFGSGSGAGSNPGAPGGGAVHLTVGGTLVLDGVVSANGATQNSSGGAGGSVWIECGTFAGAGSLTAKGGNGPNGSWGGGGGGRVAVHADAITYSGVYELCGGTGTRGGAGTAFVRQGEERGTIIVDNCGNAGETTEFDGVHSFDANMLIRNQGRVGHSHGAQGMHLSVDGDVIVEPTGAFFAHGRGYPAGQGPGVGGNAASASEGTAGGGHGGAGGNNNAGTNNGGACYGSVTEPADFGSGSGIGNGAGAPGGGAIRLTAGGMLLLNGVISADGATQNASGGAGGSVWIECGTFAGTGSITAKGGNAVNSSWGGGGGGRIAVHADAMTYSGVYDLCGGTGNRGGAGTAFIRQGEERGTIIVDNCGNAGETTEFDGVLSFDADMLVRNQGRVGHSHGAQGMHLSLDGDVIVEPTGAFDVYGRGHPAGQGPGAGANAPSLSFGTAGGGHGGAGGDSNLGVATGGACYGSVTQPIDFGSGSGAGSSAGAPGGGAIRLSVGGALLLDGVISADGATLNASGGAGGSVWIECGTFAGAGSLTARGGNGVNSSWGGGGGGRVAVHAGAVTYSGIYGLCGGTGNRGGAGTAFVKQGNERGTIIVDNCGNAGETTEFDGVHSFDANMLVRNQGRVGHSHASVGMVLGLVGDLTVESGGFVTVDGRGYAGGVGPGAGASSSSFSLGAAGGGHGGKGGSTGAGPGGSTHGSEPTPTDLGSSGGNFVGSPGRAGGGGLGLSVDGTVSVIGAISANGEPTYNGGCGSGGSILIRAGAVNGPGTIAANGGNGQNASWGGGGGGRIAIYSCGFTMPLANVTAAPGTGGNPAAQAGTVNVYSDSLDIPLQPVGATVDSGSTVTFSTQATGEGPLSFRWRRNGIDVYDDGFITGAGTPTVTVQDIECPAHSGAWDCIITDACGFAQTERAILIVNVFADLNHDCYVNAADLAIVLGGWGQPGATDLNGDGLTGASDLAILLGAWSA
ncbi:MAG: hypothetical protein JNL80_05750 [Phycisphaerae bacterium]|nr:hypothetical protein [Phycisphaerae bacterium]